VEQAKLKRRAVPDATPLFQSVAVQKDAFARVTQVTLTAETDSYSGSQSRGKVPTYCESSSLRKRDHLDRPVFRLLPQAFGESNQRAREPTGDIVDREALDAAAESIERCTSN